MRPLMPCRHNIRQVASLGTQLEDYLSVAEVSNVLRVSGRTLRRWRLMRVGPAHVKCGRTVLYRGAAVAEWLRAQEVQRDLEKMHPVAPMRWGR